ncbi:hypothetical protein IUJ58_21040 [Priestia aryabhattai]|uniref:hypothetical protein n=1 Tax=Priestia aryabhattai TaxID=412384 RepID=UPI001C0D05BB|nr:hypothetical protein [Priestia aryabhattai]MBU3573442.1 hypothetical protein [Priestia aryabhattai]WDL86411.1 hypothetical protein IUJ58_21040 [Priestia aryabhattai]
MRHQHTRLKEALDDWYGQLSSQVAAPFYLLSNAFLTAGHLSADMMGAREKTVSNRDERANFTIETADIPSDVSSFLKEKQQANELQDYIVRLIQQDLQKKSKENEVETLVHSLRKELLSEIDLLKQEMNSRFAVNREEYESKQANELQDYVAKLVEQNGQKDNREEEFQSLVHSLRTELLGEIHLLKKELCSASAPSYKQLKAVRKEEEETFKEGQLIKSEKVTGTIQEDIDVDF